MDPRFRLALALSPVQPEERPKFLSTVYSGSESYYQFSNLFLRTY